MGDIAFFFMRTPAQGILLLCGRAGGAAIRGRRIFPARLVQPRAEEICRIWNGRRLT